MTQWLATPHVVSVDVLYSRQDSLMFSLYTMTHFSYVQYTDYLWSLDIYSCRYTLISLYFTNWLFLYSLLKSLPKLQSKLMSRSQEVDLVFSHFLILFYFRFIFHIFLFIEHRVRVSHVTQKEGHRRY